MNLRFPRHRINYWAQRYQYRSDKNLLQFAQIINEQRYCSLTHLKELVSWKSPRLINRLDSDSTFVETVTRLSFDTTDERLKIEVLRLTKGIDWSIASAFLHFFNSNRYPILDRRALWSVRATVHHDGRGYALWKNYIEFCRNIADNNEVSIRTLDKALWQYSKEHQIGV